MAANTSFKPVKIKPTLTNGDCFFSAIYRAAEEQGILPVFQECTGVTIDRGEKEFIQSLRNYVSLMCEETTGSSYNFLRVLYENKIGKNKSSTETLNGIMRDPQTFDEWHRKIIRDTIFKDPPNEYEFSRRIADGIKISGRYVGDIEFNTTKTILANCHIILESKNERMKTLQKKRTVDGRVNDVITVFNCGAAHYEFFSFPFIPSKTQKSSSANNKNKSSGSNATRNKRTINVNTASRGTAPAKNRKNLASVNNLTSNFAGATLNTHRPNEGSRTSAKTNTNKPLHEQTAEEMLAFILKTVAKHTSGKE
jgi:hypothetical protein